MENMDEGLTVPKWVLINQLKIHQMPQNLSVQIVCPNSADTPANLSQHLHLCKNVCQMKAPSIPYLLIQT